MRRSHGCDRIRSTRRSLNRWSRLSRRADACTLYRALLCASWRDDDGRDARDDAGATQAGDRRGVAQERERKKNLSAGALSMMMMAHKSIYVPGWLNDN